MDNEIQLCKETLSSIIYLNRMKQSYRRKERIDWLQQRK